MIKKLKGYNLVHVSPRHYVAFINGLKKHDLSNGSHMYYDIPQNTTLNISVDDAGNVIIMLTEQNQAAVSGGA